MKIREEEENKPPKRKVMHSALSHHPLIDVQPSPKQPAPPSYLPPVLWKIHHGLSILCQCRKEIEDSYIFSILFCKTSFSQVD